MYEEPQLDPRVDKARMGLFKVLLATGRLIKAVEKLEELYADRAELPNPSYFYVYAADMYGLQMLEPGSEQELPYRERAVRARVIEAVIGLRMAADTAGRLVGDLAPIMDGAGESAHRRWTVLSAGDLRTLRSAIVLGTEPDSIATTMLPLPRAGVPAALSERGRTVDRRLRQLKDVIYSGGGQATTASLQELAEAATSSAAVDPDAPLSPPDATRARSPDDPPRVTWQQVRDHLLGVLAETGRLPKMGGVAAGLGCSIRLAYKAIEKTPRLKAVWKQEKTNRSRTPTAQGMSKGVERRAEQSTEAGPARAAEERDLDERLRQLITELPEAVRRDIESRKPTEQRAMLEQIRQQKDDERRERRKRH